MQLIYEFVDGVTEYKDTTFASIFSMEVDYRDYVFENCVFNNMQFENCDFSGADFIECKIINSGVVHCNFTSSTISAVTIKDSTFALNNLTSAYIPDLELESVAGTIAVRVGGELVVIHFGVGDEGYAIYNNITYSLTTGETPLVVLRAIEHSEKSKVYT